MSIPSARSDFQIVDMKIEIHLLGNLDCFHKDLTGSTVLFQNDHQLSVYAVENRYVGVDNLTYGLDAHYGLGAGFSSMWNPYGSYGNSTSILTCRFQPNNQKLITP